ncbi:hypothetical protein G7075_13875 [Phycicoccus sp. HDW14]|uniref:hypothetical protein n=1 Tax=Phycicoccus sp. HDW14 TaxID=2714941 RepID=UPI001408FF0E|nr:hypothetical protein [Phycicoccus sp. HDW14]QIM21966.1 hypothetical protein G7075_13875 [Phycicoccus sp. HDW14]
MTVSAQEDFGGFVAARWPDLEAVALVTTLDPAAAREATTAALATLHPRWASTLEEGAPTTAARVALLARLLPARRSRGTDRTDRTDREVPAAPAAAALESAVTDPHDAVPAALLRALAAEEPLVRCALAAEVVWECPPAETGRLLAGAGSERAVEPAVAAARERLVTAHRAARAEDDLSPADHRLEGDLEDLVHRLVALQPEPPDAGSLVGQRARSVRRRALVTGGGVLAAAGVATWWGLAAREEAPPARRPVAVPTTAGPDDAAWRSTSRWPARGALATDLGIQALVARAAPGARLLYADDVHDVRCVLAKTLTPDDVGDGTQLRMWAGSVGAPAEQLTEVVVGFGIYTVPDVVAVGVPHPTEAALLVLSQPTVEVAQYSLLARPTRGGLVSRTWRDVRLTDGVGSALLAAPTGPAARVRCGDYDGPLPVPESWNVFDGTDDDLLAPTVADITGYRADQLRERRVVSRMPARVTLPQLGAGRVTVTLAVVHTPDGGVVRSLRLATGDAAGSGYTSFGPFVVPADRAEAPYAVRVDDYSSGRATWVVTAPPGAATVQLRTDDGSDRPLARPVPVTGHAVVVGTTDLNSARVLVRDGRGRVLWNDAPVEGRFAYDTDPVTAG